MSAPRITANVLPAIARRMIRTAHRTTSCTCDVSRVRWDMSRVRWDIDAGCGFIDHAPTCPLAALGRMREAS